MAIASEDRRSVWSAMTTIELRQKSLALAMFDRSWESDWQMADKVPIPRPNWATSRNTEGVVAEVRAKGGNWATARKPDQAIATLTRTGGYGVANEIDWEDALEIPWSIVDRHRNRQAYELRHSIDTAIYDAVADMPSLTIRAGEAGKTFVPATGPYTASIDEGSDHPLMLAIDEFGTAMYRADAIDGDGSPTGSAGTPFMFVQPELARSLRKWLRDKGLHFDPVTSEILSQNPAMADGTGWVGRLSGVNLYSWNHLQVPAADAPWKCYAGIREAVAVGIRPPVVQYWDPNSNQVSEQPAHLMRQVGDYAAVEVLDSLHRKIEIVSDTTVL